jgi:hypothetical protein
MTKAYRRAVWVALLAATALALFAKAGAADQIPVGWEASNMKPIGYSDLQGVGGAFKMAIKEVNGRWYLYTGNLWRHGWNIVDVTDPANPQFAKFIPGPDETWTIQVDLHDNIMVTALQDVPERWGGHPGRPFEEGVLIWDISDPLNPKLLSHWKTGSTGTHRNGYPGGKYVNLAANMPGFTGQILVFLDISDPKNPREAGRWWMPGQKEGEPPPGPDTWFHGPAFIEGNTAYLGYGHSVVILDITDVSQLKVIGRLDMTPFKAVHDVLPIPGKPVLFANSETSHEVCDEPLYVQSLIDIKDIHKPRLMSMLPVPVPPKGLPYTDFCDKGGRFGPHNTNLLQHSPDVQKQGDLIYLTYFNAGLRIFDIRDPRLPREVGWFVPPIPTRRLGVLPKTKLVSQTEDVLVDRRGNIYISDMEWGLFVLRYTGTDPPPTEDKGPN